MTDPVTAKRIMIMGVSDLDVSARCTIPQVVGPRDTRAGAVLHQAASKC
jgi:hypothetical protein